MMQNGTLERDFLTLVIVGHVDHGKSTLIGRLLYDTESVPDSIIDDMKAVSQELGKEMEFAYLVDALKEEREQNITIDTTQTFFKSPKRNYIIVDAPGHTEFLRNMITGASAASAAILMLDVGRGMEEQTSRHAVVASLLGIKQIVVAANKMDSVEYSEQKFRERESEIKAFLKRIAVTPRYIIPISAKAGDNVAGKSGAMSWYKGPTLLEALEEFDSHHEAPEVQPLRLPIQNVYDIDGKKVAVGRIESGALRCGEEITVLPAGAKARISSIEVWQKKCNSAESGESIGVCLDSAAKIERGTVLCAGKPPTLTDKVNASVFWMSDAGHDISKELVLKCATQQVPCRIEKIESKINSSTLEPLNTDLGHLHATEVAKVCLAAKSPLVIEDFGDIEELGRFVLTINDEIVAGGIIHR